MQYGSMYHTLNAEQMEVFKQLTGGNNIFLTGNAGTGKSYLVKAYDEYCSLNGINLVKTAPTGIAALNIGGATLHHQFKLEIGLDFNVAKKYPKFLDCTDVLLIDEISMVRIDIFDKLMQIISLANNAREKKHLKAIQLIFCGDFYQLAPVITKDERPYLKNWYKCDIKEGFCFQSKYWRMFDIRLCILTKVIRQGDQAFCHALDMCKSGDAGCLDFISSHSAKSEMEDAIWVCGKNATVKEKNDEGLQRLSGRLYMSVAKYSNVTVKDNLCDHVFQYKIGAKVVMLVNDPEGDYQNGSMGIIAKIEDDTIYVKFEHMLYPVPIKPVKFPKYEYKSSVHKVKSIGDDGKETVKKEEKLKKSEIGYAEQYPMRLGYAVTIHKSQGQTYEAMNFEPEIFATGQLYVALSRCRTVECIYIHTPLTNRMVMASDEVLNFYSDPHEYSFFQKDDKMTALFVPEKYAERITKMIAEWDNAVTA